MRPSAPLVCTILALSGCGDDAPAIPETEAACPITAPVRLAAAPAGFRPDRDVWYGLYVFGDDILYTFDRLDDPRRVYWHLHRCTGELEPYPALAPGLHNPYTIDTLDGRVLYANDAFGQQFLVDRLDDPGADEPAPVPGLPAGSGPAFYWIAPRRPYAEFHSWNPHDSDEYAFGAAGLGGSTHTLDTHAGDPDVPALRLGDAVVRTWPFDQDLLVHDDSGALRRVDPLTGASEPLLAGVRHLDFLFEARKIIWQAIGDDIAEPVHLRDLDTGEDLEIGVNDFAALSWHRDPLRSSIGTWYATRDHAAAALLGPELRLVRAVRTDTGDSLAVPEHAELRGSIGPEFKLLLPDDTDRVEALWNPLTGDVRVWYRGPEAEPTLRSVDGDIAEYFLPDPLSANTGGLWRVDLRTGETARILPRISAYAVAIDDARYLLHFPTRGLAGPPYDSASYLSPTAYDLKLVDTATGLYTPIADAVSAFATVPDEGLVYLDAHGPEPGVWAHPLPFP